MRHWNVRMDIKKKRAPKRFRELDPSCAEVGRRVCRGYAVYTPVGGTLYYIGYTRTGTHTHTHCSGGGGEMMMTVVMLFIGPVLGMSADKNRARCVPAAPR